jgi:hypothetical protein
LDAQLKKALLDPAPNGATLETLLPIEPENMRSDFEKKNN